ncbi:MAG: hypothetical protein RMI00_00095 [Sulfolobales archaeon]|nr:hypothetical protein [Sulfolobales archaeon]
MGVSDVMAALQSIASLVPSIEANVSYYLALAGFSTLLLIGAFLLGFGIARLVSFTLHKPPIFLAQLVVLSAIFMVLLAFIVP